MSTLHFGPDNGDLTLHTGVAGKAARTGHRLTIGFTEWSATVDGAEPSHVRVVVRTPSLEVRSGEGGLTPMSAPERLVARSNAVKALKADKHDEIVFDASDIVADGDGYRLTGTLSDSRRLEAAHRHRRADRRGRRPSSDRGDYGQADRLRREAVLRDDGRPQGRRRRDHSRRPA